MEIDIGVPVTGALPEEPGPRFPGDDAMLAFPRQVIAARA
jgi:hypothetical protein